MRANAPLTGRRTPTQQPLSTIVCVAIVHPTQWRNRSASGGDQRALVTGCAGFLGSHLSERLVERGHTVVGVDCFAPYYSRETKERNLERVRAEPRFALVELDLATDALEGLMDGVDTVFHLAAQAGVVGSFGASFEVYSRRPRTHRSTRSSTRRPRRSTGTRARTRPPS
jgi:GDP-mannose 4,6 dehydratase